jgi:hypothetical protein
MNLTPGLPVARLCKSKQVNFLKSMEVITHSIDLRHGMRQILETLAEQFLAFDDTRTILFALL